MADTDPKAFQVLIDLRRRMPFSEHFRQMLEMSGLGISSRMAEFLGVTKLLEPAVIEGRKSLLSVPPGCFAASPKSAQIV
jgi:hypothetical protein